jgi:hypothetical protein
MEWYLISFFPVKFLFIVCIPDSPDDGLRKKLELVATRWFKYDPDDLCVNKSQFVPVIFEPPCILYC